MMPKTLPNSSTSLGLVIRSRTVKTYKRILMPRRDDFNSSRHLRSSSNNAASCLARFSWASANSAITSIPVSAIKHQYYPTSSSSVGQGDSRATVRQSKVGRSTQPAPQGQQAVAQGVSPGTGPNQESPALKGRKNERWPEGCSAAPSGLDGRGVTCSPGLTPWAIISRPCGAESAREDSLPAIGLPTFSCRTPGQGGNHD